MCAKVAIYIYIIYIHICISLRTLATTLAKAPIAVMAASPPPALLPPPPSTPRILCPASSFAAAADPGSGVSDGMSSNPLSATSPVLKVCARHSNTVMSAEESRVQPPRGLSDSCSLRSAVYEERRRGHHPLVRGDGAPSISKRRRGTIHKYPPNVPHRQHRQHCW